MQEPTIECPNCHTEIKLTESLAGPLLAATRAEYEDKLKDQKQRFQAREEALRIKEEELDSTKESLEQQVQERLKKQRVLIVEQEKQKARAALKAEIDAKSTEVEELNEFLKSSNKKLAEAQKVQADLLKKERLLDEQKRELELTVEKRVQQSISEIREKTKAEIEGVLKLKVSEKEEQIQSMQRQIEELRRKAEQGSQQLQGEVMELELEQELAIKFPHDAIEPVPKGEFGGDILQNVTAPTGQKTGSILWESKRTKNWSDGWLAKLRGDQRAAKAEIAVLISQTLPKEIETFGQIDGVWVSAPRFSIGLAIALRQTLIEVALSRQAKEGQETKMGLVYDYLTGPRFRHRVEAIVEKFTDMQTDLDRERKAMTRLWSKRENQIQSVIESTVGMYGDLQGIAGRAIKEIEGLELHLIEADDD